MTTFYILRHGETKESRDKTDYGEHIFDETLLKEAKKPLEKMGHYLKELTTDLNVSSPYERCRETVDIISEISGKQFIFDDRLDEVNIDESNDNLETRVKSLLNEIIDKDYQNILICTHGGVIAFLKQLILEKPLDINDYPDPGILTIIRGSEIEEINFNEDIV
jgi:broad specificity phosphatase PhoE